MAALNDATQTDIRAFIGSGGKLIVWPGGSDAGLSVNSTIEYMANMEKAVGAENAAAATRFYVAPGVNHCEGGAGADKTDLLTALDQWVTKGIAPATLTAEKLDAKGMVTRFAVVPVPAVPEIYGRQTMLRQPDWRSATPAHRHERDEYGVGWTTWSPLHEATERRVNGFMRAFKVALPVAFAVAATALNGCSALNRRP